jgi:hypothetical protein
MRTFYNFPSISVSYQGTSTQALEKTEEAIKNGQSRETGNIGYTRHMTKTNKKKNTTQKTKKMSNTGFTKNRSELRCPRRACSS